MNEQIKEQIVFVLADDNEVMSAALDGDLDDENKQMNRELIRRHEALIDKVKKGQELTQEDLQLIRDANEIHLNDTDNLGEHHKEAVDLEHWLDLMTELSAKEAFDILEKHLDKDSNTPAIVLRALHTLWEEITPNARAAAEYSGIIREALEDYRRWFDGHSESDIEYRKVIDAALAAVISDNSFW